MTPRRLSSPILIVGSSGHAGVVAEVVEEEGRYSIAGWIDSYLPAGTEARGRLVLGSEKDVPALIERHSIVGILVAIGDNWRRHLVVQTLKASVPDTPFISAIHPRSYVSRSSKIGAGTVVMAGAAVNGNCRIGEFCILNTHSSLDHDSEMGCFSSLAPGAISGGNVVVGSFSAICLGANISHKIRIGEHTVVGAGATVLTDLPGNAVAYGVPARVVRSRAKEEPYL